MKNLSIVFTSILLSLVLIPLSAAASPPAITEARDACTPQETWKLGSAFSQDWRDSFKAFISKKASPAEGLAEALALRRFSRSQEGRLLGEYWIARSLFEAGFIHTAYTGFGLIAAYPLTDVNLAGIQLAALDCLNRIYEQYPSLPLTQPVTSRLSFYLQHSKQRSVAWTFANHLLQNQLNYERPQAELQQTLKLLSGSGTLESLAQAWISARRHDPAATIAALEKQPSLNDQSLLLLARAYYTAGAFDQGALQLRLIKKSSNELAKALSELEWHYLLAERYSEAIGTAMSLQAGGLRHTFAPESLMVMAMALNELCQFPESLKAISSFRKNYEKPYLWLKNWESKKISGADNLYQMAILYLKKQSQVPDRIATEWVRSPVFLSHQDEINLLYKEKDSAVQFGRTGARDQKRLALEIRKQVKELKPRLRVARLKAKPGNPLPEAIKAELAHLKKQVIRFKRLHAAAPVWRVILAKHQKLVPTIEQRLVRRIQTDLSDRNFKMLGQLEEIAENNQLIEVEIFNGASQDIIWQNAHPDYKEIAKNMKNEQQPSAGKVWDWGRSPASDSDTESGEIWEDELGSFKASLYDNCSSKDRYLAIKRRSR